MNGMKKIKMKIKQRKKKKPSILTKKVESKNKT
jgi:hypothetical protein